MAQEMPKSIGFKPSEKDLQNINTIKSHFPLPDEVTTAQVLKYALQVYAQKLEENS